MTHATPTDPLWSPTPEQIRATRMDAFRLRACERTGLPLGGYEELWDWSTTDLESFWGAVWDFFGLPAVFGEHGPVLQHESMPGTSWFPSAQVNFAEFLVAAGAPGDVAIVGVDESGGIRALTRAELREQVALIARWLRDRSVRPGDRVVGYLPNVPEAIIAMLAAVGIGAVWSSVGVDYAAKAAVDRLGPLTPTVLVTTDSYMYAGARRDRADAVTDIVGMIDTLTDVLVLGDAGRVSAGGAHVHAWEEALDAGRRAGPEIEPHWERVGFDDPLWVLFSSGTTGKPKGMVQSHGGVLLEMLKLVGLHYDLGPGDRFFWFTSPSWVMWNILGGALATGASIVCYDGAPAHPDATRLWRIAAQVRATLFGASPGYLDASRATGIEPARELDLSALRMLSTTGSPLSPTTHEWATRACGGLPLYSISGGTDICTAFCGGAPIVPIWAGEQPVRNLGVAMDAWDPTGRPVRGDVGELVMTRPLPSMPIRFWNDPDGNRYRQAYFEVYPGVWRHGDWITITERRSVIIHGRSDSTLNRHGVRMGSADIYNALEGIEQIADSLVLGVEEPQAGYWMPLFVVLRCGALDDELRERIRAAIREHASPRHVPDEIIEVAGIPHTRTGKRLEVPLKRLMQGADADAVVQRTALDDPDLLEPFIAMARRRRDG